MRPFARLDFTQIYQKNSPYYFIVKKKIKYRFNKKNFNEFKTSSLTHPVFDRIFTRIENFFNNKILLIKNRSFLNQTPIVLGKRAVRDS